LLFICPSLDIWITSAFRLLPLLWIEYTNVSLRPYFQLVWVYT
jgi:hypothetical protein